MTAETKTLKMGRVRKRGVTVPAPPHQTLPPIQTQIPPQAVRHLVKEAGAVPIVAKPSKPTDYFYPTITNYLCFTEGRFHDAF